MRASERLEATVPIGDGEFLDRLRERTTGAVTRPAGSTVLLDAIIPPQRHRNPRPGSPWLRCAHRRAVRDEQRVRRH